MADKPKKAPQLVQFGEETRLKRRLLSWLNQWPDKPVDLIAYETLPPDGAGMSLFTVGGGAYIAQRWISGGYQAVYDFMIAYRIQPGEGPDNRLKADETLDSLGEWLCAEPYPDAGEKVTVTAVECVNRAAVSGEDAENGVEDHVITMKLTYKKEGNNPWQT